MKRRMPAHIVLPNGMWRFVKRGASSVSKTKRKYRGASMARRKGAKRRGSFGGIMSYIKPLLLGTAAGLITPRVPVLNSIPYGNAVLGGVAGYFGKRSIAGIAVGAAGGAIVAPPVGNALNQMTGQRIY